MRPVQGWDSTKVFLFARMGNEFGSETRSVFEFYVKAVVALAAAWSCFIFMYRNRKRRLLPPGPFPLPVIGNLHQLGTLPHQALAALSLKYGPLMSLRLGSSALTIVLSSGDMCKEFFKTHDRIFSSRPTSAAIKHLSYNLSDVAFAPYGPYWRQMRKVCVLQLLSSRRIESFRFIREEEVSVMIRSILDSNAEHHQGSRPFNLSKTVSALTNAIICRMALGRKYSDEDVVGSAGFNSMVKETLLLAGSFNVGDYVPYLAWIDDLRGLNRRLKNVHISQDQYLEKVIDEHVNAQNDCNVAEDLVDVLLAASEDKDMEFQITRENIKAVIFDMLVGGMDTSSTTIEWTMSELLRNPPVMKKLQDELERVVGKERRVTESDLPSLLYLQAVVTETLRLHPAAPFGIHLSVEDCIVLGYHIPRNTRVLLNLWAIGRNTKTWGEDVESFRPDRFVDDEGGSANLVDAKTQENFEWLPFGAGRRGCPGRHLATLVVELAVAQLLHCFNWKLPLDGQELDMTENFNGLTLPRAHELLAIPTPRLPVL